MPIWIRKYSPKTLDEVQGQNKAVQRLKSYVENYKKGQKPLLLHGPQGVGKTASVHALANENNYELVELNASDFRKKDDINSIIGSAVQQRSLFGGSKLILIDEVDGLAGRKDYGGVGAINKLIKDSHFPIVLAANDPYDRKIKSLRKKCELLEFSNLNYTSIRAYLRKICKAENIDTTDDVLSSLARAAGGDMRAAINDLQSFTYNGKLRKEDLDMAYSRDHTEKIINALVRIFKTKNLDVALSAFDDVQENLDEIFLWVEENLPREYKKPKDLAEAFDNLSIADIFNGRIRRRQYYRFYVYCYNLLSAGIALSKEEKYEGFTKYGRSQKPLKIWISNNKKAKKKSIAEKIAAKTHTSQNEAMHTTFDYIRGIFKHSPEEAVKIAKYLGLESEEVAYLKK